MKSLNRTIKTGYDLDDFIERNKSMVDKLIYLKYGKVVNHLDYLDDNDIFVLRKSILIENLTNYNLNLLLSQDDNSDDSNNYKDLNPYIAFVNLEFIKVESVHEDYFMGSNMESGIVEEYFNHTDYELSENDIFFGIIDTENDLNTIENMILLKEYEYEDIFYVFDEFRIDNIIDVLVTSMLYQRIAENLISYIDDLLYTYSYELYEKYLPEDLQSFYIHITTLIDYFIQTSDSSMLLDIDYYMFIEYLVKEGMFHIEGELESFVGILEIILYNESNRDINLKPALSRLRYTIENLFLIKDKYKHKFKLTPKDLVREIKKSERNKVDLTGIFKMANVCEGLSKFDNITITKAKEKITKKSLREVEEIFLIYQLLMAGEESDTLEDEINLCISMSLANNLVTVDEYQTINFEDRYTFFCSPSFSEFYANIVTSVLKKETFERYIGRSLSSSDIFEKTIDSIRVENPAILKDEKYGNKALEILYLSGILRRDKFGNDYAYTLDNIGKIVSETLNNREKDSLKKVINVDFSK